MTMRIGLLLLAIACYLLSPTQARAQDHAYGYTSVYVDSTNMVRGYHRTEVDYNTEIYYTPYVCGSLFKDGVEVVRACQGGFASATRNTQTWYSAGSTYSALSDHYVDIEYQEEDYYYQDVLGYFFSGAGSQPIDWYYVASGIYNSRPDQSIHLGDTNVPLAQDVDFVDVSLLQTSLTAQFSSPTIYIANLNLGSNQSTPDACGGDIFKIRVNFSLKENAQDCCTNPITSRVRLRSNNKFELVSSDPGGGNQDGGYSFFVNETNNRSRWVIIRLRRRPNNVGSANGLAIYVEGTWQNGNSFSGSGSVNLLCP